MFRFEKSITALENVMFSFDGEGARSFLQTYGSVEHLITLDRRLVELVVISPQSDRAII